MSKEKEKEKEKEKDTVSEEDLDVLKKTKREQENATANAKVAELLYENTLLKIYLKYGLSSTDGFDQETGKIIKEKKEADDESTETEEA